MKYTEFIMERGFLFRYNKIIVTGKYYEKWRMKKCEKVLQKLLPV